MSDADPTLLQQVEELNAERELLREQVRQLHRAKVTNDLLAGVAHDLNSALVGLVWCGEALRKRNEDDPDLSGGLADFVGGAEFARALAQRLVAIARREEADFCRVNLTRALQDALEMLEMLRPRNAKLQVDLGSPDHYVHGDETQLQQLLLNLAANAFEAMGKAGGVLSVVLEPTSNQGSRRPWLRLTVRDTGPGMSAEVRRRAFEPFYTTKGNQGAGLGLSVVRTITDAHGGRVSLGPGPGTTIRVQLPEIPSP